MLSIEHFGFSFWWHFGSLIMQVQTRAMSQKYGRDRCYLRIPNDLPQEAEPPILNVALTESRPDLLAVALQDATPENLKVFVFEITFQFVVP